MVVVINLNPTKMTDQAIKEFVRLVRAMRTAQKEYFNAKNFPTLKKSKLIESKAAESKVDAALQELSKVYPEQSTGHQAALFDPNFLGGVI